MTDLLNWGAFFTASIVLLLIPGPSVMYVVSRGVDLGYRGAVFSAIGLALGDLLQVLCTVLGLSALLASSSLMFNLVKYAGAAYLIGLGVRRLVVTPAYPSRQRRASGHTRPDGNRSLVIQAFFALNPKTAIFFLAFFPQFVTGKAGPPWLEILLFGLAFVLLGFVTNSIYGVLGGTLGVLAKDSHRFQNVSYYISGIVLIGMGIAAALASAPHKLS